MGDRTMPTQPKKKRATSTTASPTAEQQPEWQGTQTLSDLPPLVNNDENHNHVDSQSMPSISGPMSTHEVPPMIEESQNLDPNGNALNVGKEELRSMEGQSEGIADDG